MSLRIRSIALDALEDVRLDERAIELHLDERLGHPARARDEVLDRGCALRPRRARRDRSRRASVATRALIPAARIASRERRTAFLPARVAVEKEDDGRARSASGASPARR